MVYSIEAKVDDCLSKNILYFILINVSFYNQSNANLQI